MKLESIDDELFSRYMQRLTVEQKVGQLIWMPFSGLHKPRPEWNFDTLVDWIERFHVGGFVMYGGDVFETPAAINYLQRRSKLQLLIASDMERGCGHQVRSATVLPSHMAIGASGSVENAALAGRITAAEARSLGVNVILAPVADVNSEPTNPIVNTRAFSDDVELVSAMSASFASGCQSKRAIAVAKHFPGHGAATVDSHLTLPTIDLSAEELNAEHIPPFAAAIRAGVGGIMVGHLRCPSLDPQLPASLSYKTMTELLRQRLGFNGFIMTDALMMGAIAGEYGDAKSAVLALKGGADVVLYPRDIRAAVAGVLEAIKSGDLKMETVDAAVARVLRAKVSAGLFKERHAKVEDAEGCLRNETNAASARKIAEEAVTLVGQDLGFLPMSLPATVAILGSPVSPPGFQPFISELAAALPLRESGHALRLLRTEAVHAIVSSPFAGSAGAAADGILAGANRLALIDVDSIGSDEAVVCAAFLPVRAFSGSISPAPEEAALLRKLLGTTKRFCLVSFGNPYVASDFADAAARICVYSDCEESQRAAARVLLGKLKPRGKLPVKLSSGQ